MQPIAESAAVPIGIGGDHLVTLAELRALAKVHGPLGLVHLDSHTDLWDAYNGLPYAHGTMFRRAIEEGVLRPARMIQLGMRGPLYGEDDEAIPGDARRRDRGLAGAGRDDARRRAASASGARIGDGPTFCTFDVDFVDPAFAPGTGTPEVGGPTSHQALQLYRALAPIPFVGYDVVEVAPQYDGPGQVTALLASMVVFEALSQIALRQTVANRTEPAPRLPRTAYVLLTRGEEMRKRNALRRARRGAPRSPHWPSFRWPSATATRICCGRASPAARR